MIVYDYAELLKLKKMYAYPAGLKGSPGGLKLTIKVAVSGFRSSGDWGPIELSDRLLSNLKPESNASKKYYSFVLVYAYLYNMQCNSEVDFTRYFLFE